MYKKREEAQFAKEQFASIVSLCMDGIRKVKAQKELKLLRDAKKQKNFGVFFVFWHV